MCAAPKHCYGARVVRLVGAWLMLVGATVSCGGSSQPAESTPPEPAHSASEAAPEFDAEAYMDEPAAASSADDSASGAGAPTGDDDTSQPAPLKRDLSVEETRTVQAMFDIVQKNRQPFRECYEAFLQRSPGIKGDLTIHFVLDPEGQVKSAELNAERSTLTEPQLVVCAVQAMQRLRFPASSRGLESKVNYPFNFNP